MNEGYLEILNSISSSNPTPGGGSVAALTLAHAHSLSVMVSRLTVNSEKWIDGHTVANNLISQSENNISRCITLANQDSRAFDGVMEAYRLPKDEEGVYVRSNAIRKATIKAAEAPLETMKFSLEFMNMLSSLSVTCNANALTDLASAAELGFSACKMAEYNVRINIDHLSGDDIDSLKTASHNLLKECNQVMSEITQVYTNRLGW